jgi:hypothetical protein
MIGQDGSWKYSNEVEVNFGTDKITWIGNPQPNPAENGQAVKIPFSIIDGTDYNLSVFDINGKKMNVEIGIGNNMITISTSNLPNGTYNVILNAGDTRQSKQMKVIK